MAQAEQYQGDHLKGDGTPERHLEDFDQAEHERQRYGESRLGQHPGVPERVQKAHPPCGMRGCADKILESPCAGITRIRFSGSAPACPLSLSTPRWFTFRGVSHRRTR